MQMPSGVSSAVNTLDTGKPPGCLEGLVFIFPTDRTRGTQFLVVLISRVFPPPYFKLEPFYYPLFFDPETL
jgi:hypothetical protein